MSDDNKTGSIFDYKGVSPIGPVSHDEDWQSRAHEVGISFVAPWEDPFGGFPEHARRLARALDSEETPVHLRSLDPGMQWLSTTSTAHDRRRLRDAYHDLLMRSVRFYSVGIHMAVADDIMLQRLVTHRHLDPKQLRAVNKYKIISTVFERDRVSDAAVRFLNQVGQVWVANPTDKEMLTRCGVEHGKIRVIPIPHFPNDPHLALSDRTRTPGPVRFYHVGKWEHRKAHHELLGSFLLAFRPGEAKLYFKTTEAAPDFSPYPSSPEESVQRWLQDERVKANGWASLRDVNRDIFLMRTFLSSRQMVELHKTGDVYLSLSRGEGFDMPAYDAKLSGNLLVYTPTGGPKSFASETDIRVEPTGAVPCHAFYRWADAEYLDYDVEEAARALRTARRRIMAGRRPRPFKLVGFTADEVATAMRHGIEDVLEAAKEEEGPAGD